MSNRKKTLNDTFWQAIFDKYSILDYISDDGKYVISAKQIREFREPRLMAKVDHKLNLPKIFDVNKLGILPISRGEYVISHFECFQKITQINDEIIDVKFPPNIESINPYGITSEGIAINCALMCNIFMDFLADEPLAPTICGRMGSGKFDFSIKNTLSSLPMDVNVNNAQIEIDAAYEGIENLTLIEAKCDVADDFIVRQLFYPFKTWEAKVSKKIRLIYMVFSNDIFSLYEYRVSQPNHYNSLELVQAKRYSFEDTEVSISDIESITNSVKIISEPPVPFPQANSFERVINLCELLSKHPLTKEEVTAEYDFDIRQTDYYVSAGRYLGLIRKDKDQGKLSYHLTQKAVNILKLRYRERQLQFCSCILEHEIFYTIFQECKRLGQIPDNTLITSIMKTMKLAKEYGDTTFHRRASTISAWLDWIFGLCS